MKIVGLGRTYREISSQAIYEADFVESIVGASKEIFPGFECGRFAPLVDSPYGASRPDLILVDDRYRTWCVVEVELEHHSLSGHVEPQIRCLASARYDSAEVLRAAQASLPAMNLRSLEQMLCSVPPQMVVIVPESKPRWRDALSPLGAIVTVVQVFEDAGGHRLYRVNGEQPRRPPSEAVGYVSRVPGMPTGLEAVGLPIGPDDDLVEMLFESEITRWRVVRPGGRLYLLPADRCPLPEGKSDKYSVVLTAEGVWEMEKNGN